MALSDAGFFLAGSGREGVASVVVWIVGKKMKKVLGRIKWFWTASWACWLDVGGLQKV